jgi:arabinogalactan endo-1,4-beta-galactosidase
MYTKDSTGPKTTKAAFNLFSTLGLFFVVIVSCPPVDDPGASPEVDRMVVGADISFIDQEEYWDVDFYEDGVKKEALDIFRDNGFDYIRLRLFVNPNDDLHYDGYNVYYGQPEEFCGLTRTIAFAQRIKAKGFRFLLDLHFSDTWADPANQHKPNAWVGLSFTDLKTQVYDYTRDTLQAFEAAGVLPDMIQIGNEIGPGFLWDSDPSLSGAVGQFSNFTDLLKQGVQAVKDHAPGTKIMIHNQNSNSLNWFQNIITAGVDFDYVGVSYYPQFGAVPSELRANLLSMAQNLEQDIFVVEYSGDKAVVYDALRDLPGRKGKGAFIWEPANWNDPGAENLLDWQEGLQRGRHTNAFMDLYPSIADR